MAFPTIPTVADGRVLTGVQNNTTATRTFPNLSGLSKEPGDLLIAIVVCYQSSTTSNIFSSWGGGFTEFHDSGGSSQMCVGMAYKWSDGTETGTFSVTQAATVTGHAAFILLAIPGAHLSTPPEAGSRAVGTTGAANPASFNPSGWDAEDTLWIAVGGSGETSTTGSFTGMGSAPANYSNYVESAISQDATGGTQAAVAFRQLNAASEDVGTFTVDTSSARNVAVVVAVRPSVNPFIDSVTPDEFDDGEAGIVIAGGNFLASQGSGVVEISDNQTYGAGSLVEQTIDSWSATSIELGAVDRTGLGVGQLFVFVTNDNSDVSLGSPVTAHRAKAFALAASANIAAGGANTTAQLTPPSGKSTGDFGGGRIQDDENPGDAVDLGTDEYREDEWSIEALPAAVDGETYQFRVIRGSGTPIATYTVTPEWTISTGETFNDSVSESGIAAETQTAQRATARSVDESETLTESQAATAVFVATQAESEAVVETQSATWDFLVATAESSAATDTQSATRDLSVAVAESLGGGGEVELTSNTSHVFGFAVFSGTVTGVGQSFTADQTGYLTKATFYMDKTGSPAGNIVARLYAASGTVGTNAEPTGSILAESDPVAASSLTVGAGVETDFTFDGSFEIQNGNDYVIVVFYNGTADSVFIEATTSGAHHGNIVLQDSNEGDGWLGDNSLDLGFLVYITTGGGIQDTQDATVDAGAIEGTVAESETIAEAQSAVATFAASQSDTGTAAETQVATWDFLVSTSESETAAEAQDVTVDYALSTAETVTAAELQDASVSLDVATDESASAADAQDVIATLGVSVADSLSAVESQDALIDYAVSVAESETATDSQSVTLDAVALVSESESISDTQTVIATFVVDTDESATITDTQDAETEGLLSGVISETATITDTQDTLNNTFNASVSESEVITDTQTATFGVSASISESATIADTQDAAWTTLSEVAESATVSDAQDSTVDIVAAVSESTTAAESQDVDTDYAVSVSETAAAVDSSLGGVVYTEDVSESATITDAQDGIAGIGGSVSESVSATDSQDTENNTFTGTVSETITASDDCDATVVFSVAQAETATIADVQAGGTSYAPRDVSEAVTPVDSCVVVVTFVAQASEAAAADEDQTGLPVYPVSIAESMTAIDLQSAFGTLLPSPPGSGHSARRATGSQPRRVIGDPRRTVRGSARSRTKKG